MHIWQTAVFAVIAGVGIACLLGVGKAIQKLAKGISGIETELKKMNSKLAAVEAVNDAPVKSSEQGDNDLEAIEAAISSFEKLKRIDLTES